MEGQHWTVADWQCHLYAWHEAASLVVVPYLEGNGDDLRKACASLNVKPCHLLIVNHPDWNDCYSPWPIPSPFEKEGVFQGFGKKTLASLTNLVLPQAEARLQSVVTERAVVGYSMAGLFSLYAALWHPIFSLGASVSGALWAPGLIDFLRSGILNENNSLQRFYFSLGNKERKTRHPVLAPLAEQTLQAEQLLREAGISTTYEINPGNHFTEPDWRMAKAIQWLLEGV